MDISERIKKIRDDMGLTQAEFARLVGVDQSAISQWELGKNEPTWYNLAKISKACNVSMDDFSEFSVLNLDERTQNLLSLIRHLSPSQQAALIEFLKTID